MYKLGDFVIIADCKSYSGYSGKKAVVLYVQRLADYKFIYRLELATGHVVWVAGRDLLPYTDIARAVYGE